MYGATIVNHVCADSSWIPHSCIDIIMLRITGYPSTHFHLTYHEFHSSPSYQVSIVEMTRYHPRIKPNFALRHPGILTLYTIFPLFTITRPITHPLHKGCLCLTFTHTHTHTPTHSHNHTHTHSHTHTQTHTRTYKCTHTWTHTRYLTVIGVHGINVR